MGTREGEKEFFRVDYNKDKDVDGDECVVPTVWLGNQGFNLTAQYEQGEQSAQEHAEWFVSMFKKAIDNYTTQQTTSQKETIERLRGLVETQKEYIQYLTSHSATYESALSTQSWWEGLSESILQQGWDLRKRIEEAEQLLKETEPKEQ